MPCNICFNPDSYECECEVAFAEHMIDTRGVDPHSLRAFLFGEPRAQDMERRAGVPVGHGTDARLNPPWKL